jgi:hypothetical protein
MKRPRHNRRNKCPSGLSHHDWEWARDFIKEFRRLDLGRSTGAPREYGNQHCRYLQGTIDESWRQSMRLHRSFRLRANVDVVFPRQILWGLLLLNLFAILGQAYLILAPPHQLWLNLILGLCLWASSNIVAWCAADLYHNRRRRYHTI